MINLEDCPRNDNFQLAKIRCISNARIPLLFPIRYKLLHFE